MNVVLKKMLLEKQPYSKTQSSFQIPLTNNYLKMTSNGMKFTPCPVLLLSRFCLWASLLHYLVSMVTFSYSAVKTPKSLFSHEKYFKRKYSNNPERIFCKY